MSWVPASCIPSPESPAKRTTTESSSSTGFAVTEIARWFIWRAWLRGSPRADSFHGNRARAGATGQKSVHSCLAVHGTFGPKAVP